MVFFGCIGYTKNKSLRYLGPFLSSNFQIFPKKQERFPKFGNFTEGKMFGRLRITIFGEKKREIWKYKKLREKNTGNLDKSPSIRTALIISHCSQAA